MFITVEKHAKYRTKRTNSHTASRKNKTRNRHNRARRYNMKKDADHGADIFRMTLSFNMNLSSHTFHKQIKTRRSIRT
ncbi:MAG: hypothetical protein CMJ19_16850 [Phycisphaeraceae bacterium]|nr:hypothetical protein [Phycisphaeraceae bacterium]